MSSYSLLASYCYYVSVMTRIILCYNSITISIFMMIIKLDIIILDLFQQVSAEQILIQAQHNLIDIMFLL